MVDAGYIIRAAYVALLKGNILFGSSYVPIYDQVPSDSAFPYVYFSDFTQAEDKNMGHKENFGQDCTITLTVCNRYVGNSGTSKDVDDIANRITALVRGASPQSPQISFAPTFNNFGTNVDQTKTFKITAVDKSVIYYRTITFRHNIQQL